MKFFTNNVVRRVVIAIVVLVVGLGATWGFGFVNTTIESNQQQEEARQQEQQEARDELQQLKGEVQVIQYLSAKSDFSAIRLQEALKEQLRSSIEEVEESDNQYLQDVSIPIAEDSVLVACDEATEYINHWIDEIG